MVNNQHNVRLDWCVLVLLWQVSENVAEKRQLQLQLQQDEGALAEARNVAAAADAAKPATAPTTTTTTTTRALASSEIDAGYGGDHQFETGAIDSVFGGRSTVAQRVHALNAGLWGPNEEEEKEIEMELARLREEVCEGVCMCMFVCLFVCALRSFFPCLKFDRVQPTRTCRRSVRVRNFIVVCRVQCVHQNTQLHTSKYDSMAPLICQRCL